MFAQTSFPGYKQVEAFGPDEEYEEGEEVSYVTLDLGAIEPALLPSCSTYRLIGLDTPTPYLQLAGSVFVGRHDNLLGTELLFSGEKNDDKEQSKRLVHVGSTEQRILFSGVQLKEKVHALVTETSAPPEDEDMPMSSGTTMPVFDQHLEKLTGRSTSPMYKPSKRSRKGKEKAIDNGGSDIMDTHDASIG